MITQPYVNFIVPNAGGKLKPISNGTIYIGKEGLDPKLGGNPIYYRDNEGTEVEISNPIYLNATGVIVESQNSSKIISPYVKRPASILILDRNGKVIWDELSDVNSQASKKYVDDLVTSLQNKVDFVFDNVDAMIAGTVGTETVTHVAGKQYSTGGTTWRVVPYVSDVPLGGGLYAERMCDLCVKDFENLVSKGDPNDPATWNWTPAIQRAITYRGDIDFPYDTYYVKPEQITFNLQSDTSINLNRSLIQCTGVSLDNYKVFYSRDTSRVYVKNGDVKGERNTHIGTTGESAILVCFLGVTNCGVPFMRLRDSWGDGLYIGRGNNQYWCENVDINGLEATNNRRNNFSLISVKGMTAQTVTLKDANGTPPQLGLDIEPNLNDELIQGVKIDTLITDGNVSAGLGIFIDKLVGSGNPVSIEIRNHIDNGSKYGALFAACDGVLGGKITMSTLLYDGQVKNGLTTRNWAYTAPRIEIESADIKVNHSRKNDLAADTPIAISGVGNNNDIGNISIKNYNVSYYPNQSGTGFAISLNANARKVDINNPPQGILGSDRLGDKSTLTGLSINSFGGNADFPFAQDPVPKTTITNRAGQGKQVVNLTTPLSSDITYRIFNSQGNGDSLEVRPPSGGAIFPAALVDGSGYIQLPNKGDSIDLIRYEGDWYVVEKSY